jgi:hypothetical protein
MNFKRLKSLTAIVFLLGHAALLASSPDEKEVMSEKRLTFSQVIEDVKFEGLSGREHWGCWSDGGLVSMKFSQRLPRKFILLLSAEAYAQNTDADIEVKCGWETRTFSLPKAMTISLNFSFVDNEDTISFAIPHPTCPTPAGQTGDTRLLGIKFFDMLIHPIDPDLTIPAGCIMAYAGSDTPSGWASCAGYTRACFDYPELFHAIGYKYTNSKEVTDQTKFSLPKIRGKLISYDSDSSDDDEDSAPKKVEIKHIIKY